MNSDDPFFTMMKNFREGLLTDEQRDVFINSMIEKQNYCINMMDIINNFFLELSNKKIHYPSSMMREQVDDKIRQKEYKIPQKTKEELHHEIEDEALKLFPSSLIRRKLYIKRKILELENY
jgi:hypothetical protein